MNTKIITLKDIVELVIDYRGKTPKKLGGKWSEFGIKALSAKNIKNGEIVRKDSIRYVDEELYYKWMKNEIEKGDILLTSEATFGEIYYWESDEKIVLSQRIFGIRCNSNKVYPKFIYFYMLSPMFQWELKSRATGTTVKGLRQPELLKCKLNIPDYDNQTKIAKILSNIENKIKVIKKINHNLDTIAKLIYKGYFEDFKFFSDIRFKNSELGKIPDNWKTFDLNSIAKIYNGYSYKSKELQKSNCAMLTIKNFNRNGSFKTEGFKEIVYSEKIKDFHFINENDVLIACTDVTQNADIIGNCILLQNKKDYKEIIMSMDLVKVESKFPEINNFLLASILKSYRFKKHILGYVNGTTVLHLDKKGILNFTVALPQDLSKLVNIEKKLEYIYRKISINSKEINYLENLKSILLPKLMSGEIDVSNIKL